MSPGKNKKNAKHDNNQNRNACWVPNHDPGNNTGKPGKGGSNQPWPYDRNQLNNFV